MKNPLTPFLLLTYAAVSGFSLQAANINIAGATSDWTAIIPSDSNRQSDYFNDQQAKAADVDIIGTSAHPGFFVQFWNGGDDVNRTDGELAFRLRISGDTGSVGYSNYAFVGMDLNLDGTLDLFAETGNGSVYIRNAGTGANNSPSTTTISSSSLFSYTADAANFSWQAVSPANDPGVASTDLDASNGNDYFVSFLIPFADLVTAAANPSLNLIFDDSMPLAYVAVTGTQNNSLNSDFNALTKNEATSTLSWQDLGAISESVSVDGTVVPEPATFAFLMGFLVLGFRIRSRITG